MLTKLHGREVEYEIEFGSDVTDTFIGRATWLDTDTALDDCEVEELTQLEGSVLDEEWLERQISTAEARMDAEKDME
jgi:hypothetical protein